MLFNEICSNVRRCTDSETRPSIAASVLGEKLSQVLRALGAGGARTRTGYGADKMSLSSLLRRPELASCVQTETSATNQLMLKPASSSHKRCGCDAPRAPLTFVWLLVRSRNALHDAQVHAPAAAPEGGCRGEALAA